MKSLEKASKGSPSAVNLAKGEQYGLGIHVFKIESLKSVPPPENKNQKHLMKNNENPFVSKPPLPKRNINIPIIQKQKTSDVIKSRKTIRKQINKNNTMKPSLSLNKPSSQSYQTNAHSLKKMNNNENIQPKHIFKNYNSSLNQIINFYIQYQTDLVSREKQLRKINIGQRELPQVFKRKFSSCVIDDIVNHQELNKFDIHKQYEEYSIIDYTNRQGFKIFDYENERKKQII